MRAALTLDRNLAVAHAVIGLAKFLLVGRRNRTSHQRAFRLSPRDTQAHRWWVYVALPRRSSMHAEAVVWLRRGLDVNRNYSVTHFDLAALLARLGKLDEARLREAGLRSIHVSPYAATVMYLCEQRQSDVSCRTRPPH